MARVALGIATTIGLTAIGGCTVPVKVAPEIAWPADFQPRLNGTLNRMKPESIAKLRQLQLISTDLVSTLIQVPDFDPTTVTMQVSAPASAFGNSLLRALEDAGYGLQWVSSDQGNQYVSYSQRFAETDSGPVTDFEINIGPIRIRREYKFNGDTVLPSSLMYIVGTAVEQEVDLNEEMFREQGVAGDVFVSGVINPESHSIITAAGDVTINAFDRLPESMRTRSANVLDLVRRRMTQRRAVESEPDLSRYRKLRRTVLVFEDNQNGFLGVGNKQVVSLLAQEYGAEDMFVITPCTDSTGREADVLARGERVAREFSSHGIPLQALYLAPCASAAYRSVSDNALVGVTVVHHRLDNNT
jgi:hypothetical protein